MQLVRVFDALPRGFESLRREALGEGFNHVERLAAEWADEPEMFLSLLAAFEEGELAGVAALTAEPASTSERAFRMRRLYVRPAMRRCGVGRALVNALLQEALDSVSLVTVNAGPGSGPFWEALDFRPVAAPTWSHEFRPYRAGG